MDCLQCFFRLSGEDLWKTGGGITGKQADSTPLDPSLNKGVVLYFLINIAGMSSISFEEKKAAILLHKN